MWDTTWLITKTHKKIFYTRDPSIWIRRICCCWNQNWRCDSSCGFEIWFPFTHLFFVFLCGCEWNCLLQNWSINATFHSHIKKALCSQHQRMDSIYFLMLNPKFQNLTAIGTAIFLYEQKTYYVFFLPIQNRSSCSPIKKLTKLIVLYLAEKVFVYSERDMYVSRPLYPRLLLMGLLEKQCL